MPDIPTLHGLTHHAYNQALVQHDLARHAGPDGRWTVALTDTHSEWYGGVLTIFGHPCMWFVGNSNGLTETHITASWPWEAVDTVRHIIACHAFRAGHQQGTLTPYWTSQPV